MLDSISLKPITPVSNEPSHNKDFIIKPSTRQTCLQNIFICKAHSLLGSESYQFRDKNATPYRMMNKRRCKQIYK